MSAMTAPIGWRRTLAAICSGVGKQAPGQARGRRGGGRGGWPGRRARALAAGRGGPGCGVQAVGVAEEPRFERVGAVQAAGDACEDQRDVGGAEAAYDGTGVGEGALAERGGEFAAVVDELADEAEEVAGAAGLGGWIEGVGRGHERNKNIRWRRVSRNIFRTPIELASRTRWRGDRV